MGNDMIADLLPVQELYRLAASIMRRHAPFIRNQTQDDTIQDLILAALQSIKSVKFECKNHLVAWVYTSMKNRALRLVNDQFWQKNNNGATILSTDFELNKGIDEGIKVADLISDGKDWEADMIAAIDDETLIDRLYMIRDEKLRDIMQRRINGETLRGIAETYGITYQAVASYINNGFRRFPWLEQWLKCGIMEVNKNDE